MNFSYNFFWGLCWIVIATRGLSLVAVSEGYSLVAGRRLLIALAPLLPGHRLQGTWALELGLSECHAWV